MYQRPKFNESDEDLLKLQEEFFKNKQQSDFKLASTLVSVKANPSKPSPSSESADHPQTTQVKTQDEEIQEYLDNTFEDIPKNIQIGNIVEKKATGKMSAFKFSRTGFPQTKRRDLNISSGKGSIFSQQMKKLRSNNVQHIVGDSSGMEIDEGNCSNVHGITEHVKTNLSGTSNNDPMNCKGSVIKCSTVIETVKEQIHLENLDKMNKMSLEEIQAEREKLMSTLDPAIIAFLKSKRHHNQPKVDTRHPSIAEQNKSEKEIMIEEIESAKSLLSKPNSGKWIHFNLLEGNKLAWMKDVAKPNEPIDKKYEARFDFAGWLLPFAQDEINDQNRMLYHHGEEPGRPGYTLQELFQLCRSNVIQQKVIALNTIAAILNLNSTGLYDRIIDIPIEQVFFVLRFCLDENTPATLGASIKAMRNLFCNSIDETCLDCLLGFGLGEIQPNLAVDESSDDNTVNDQQLAEENMVKCLFRSGILTRIRYILNVIKPSDIETIVNCLDILIRLARDSEFIALELYQFDGLMESVIGNFLPMVITTVQSTTAYDTPLIQAVKLLRVLASRNVKIARELLTKYKIFDSIATYLSNENLSLNATGLKLQIESLQLWETLTFYKLAVDYFKILRPVLITLLDYHGKNTNVDSSWTMQTHISALLHLLAQVASKDYCCVLEYVKILFEGALPKWLTQFLHVSFFSCGKLQLISSLFNLLTAIRQYQPLNVHLPWENVCKLIEKLIASDAFKIATDDIKSSSNILNNYELYKSSPNLKFTESVAWNTADHIVPVLQTKSCVPFLNKIGEFIANFDSMSLKLMFLNHENVNTYLQHIQRSGNLYLTSNWYTKMEVDFIVSTLRMAVQLQTQLDTALHYEVAVKSLCVFTPEMKYYVAFIFDNIIFSQTFYPTEVLLKNLNIQDENVLKLALEDVVNIQKVYVDVLDLSSENLMCNQTRRILNVSRGNIIPLDWIYSPIIALYSNNEPSNSKVSEVAKNFIISNCLRWVYIYETYFPDLANMINPTDKFCRLACTYLGSDSLFLLPEIQTLLKSCLLQILSQHEAELDFDKAIHGLKSFQDLYTQLLEQYQGVSYGDKLFGQFLLVPLAQRHNVKFRKAVWSEYAGVVQIFNVTPDELMIDINKYLEPVEDDTSLLRCYQRIVSAGAVRRFSAFYKIATHHMSAFRDKQECKQEET